MTDENDRARATGLELLERFGRDRALLVMAVDCGGNAGLPELAGEVVEPDRNIEDAAQEIDMRARSAPCLCGRAQGQSYQRDQEPVARQAT